MIDTTTAHKENLPTTVFEYEHYFAGGNITHGDPLRSEHLNTEDLLSHQNHSLVDVDANISTQPGILRIAGNLFREDTRHWTQPDNAVPGKDSSVHNWETLDPSGANWSGWSSIDTRQHRFGSIVQPSEISSRLDEHQSTSLRQESPDKYLEFNLTSNKIVSKYTDVHSEPISTISDMEGTQGDFFSSINEYISNPVVYFRAAHAYPSEFEGKASMQLLIANGKAEIADKIIKLKEIIRDESDDYQQEMQLGSLRLLADFFTRFDVPYSPHGCITVGYDGVLGAGWTIPLSQQPTSQWRNWEGILSLEFLPSGKVLFSGETRQFGDIEPFSDVGEDVPSAVYERIKPFFEVMRLHDAT